MKVIKSGEALKDPFFIRDAVVTGVLRLSVKDVQLLIQSNQ